MNRRSFLQTATAGATAFSFIPHARSAPPAQKLNLGVIGTQGRARSNIAGVKGENIVALVDVDADNLAMAGAEFPQAKRHRDFREMLQQRDIDAVVVSTPDHTHAVCTAHALRSGRHVYCEKPLTHTVSEARFITDLAAKTGLKTQMGNQIHSHPMSNYRRVVELIQSGAIGKVAEVHVWSSARNGVIDRQANPGRPPQALDYDLWLGPVRYTPYRPEYMPKRWRNFWHFGGGTLADFWCHYVDLAHWSLKLNYPATIAASGDDPHPIFTTLDMQVEYLYPARGEDPAVRLTWHQGRFRPTHLLPENVLGKFKSGILFVGEGGMLLTDYTRRILLPEKKFAAFAPPKPWIPDSVGHHEEWIRAIKHGGWSATDFSYSGPLTEAGLLGIVAHRTGRKLHWDPVNLKALGAPEADQFIQHDYRDGWAL